MEPFPFSQQLRSYRRSSVITQAEAAEQLGVSSKTVQRWERGKSRPRPVHRRNFAGLLKRNEACMKRRAFLHAALLASLSFAPAQENLLSELAGIFAVERVPSPEQEQAALHALVDACWLLLPHFSNTVGTRHLARVQDFRKNLNVNLQESSDPRLAEALCQIEQVEGRLLYAMKRLKDASYIYQHAIQVAKEFNNPVLEAIGLTWYSNFLIDTKQASQALAPAEEARRITSFGRATPLLRSWIFATGADTWANLQRPTESQRALSQAVSLMDQTTPLSSEYRIPYDKEWV